ncbi:hypothetical protein [Herbiconiux sp. YIM B11900]|uniref:hypothetical protein n=1 Tax=Herbiconiux sp. YIM B11900 TaxID=3404131 RepID=UPI003F83279A
MSRLRTIRTALYLAGIAAFLGALVTFLVPGPELEPLGTALVLAAWPLLLCAAILSVVVRVRSADEAGTGAGSD